MPYSGRLETSPLLEVIQVIAYSQRSGLLSVESSETSGVVVFDHGNIVCAHSTSARSLLDKAASETDSGARLSLRRIQALTALRELFEIGEGDFHFVQKDEPVAELEGLDIRGLYASEALETGDLLLVLEKAMDDAAAVGVAALPESSEARAAREEEDAIGGGRTHPRYGPFIIKAELVTPQGLLAGYLTNLSEGGTFFNADELPEPGTACRVQFELPWGLGRCQAEAKVVWQRVEGPDTRKGVGLSFLEFPPDSKRRVAAYLERFSELVADVEIEA